MQKRTSTAVALAMAMGATWAAGQASAQTRPAAPEASVATPASKGILPIPDYTGDIWTRAYLTGDWGGTRTDLANKGFQVDVDWIQTLQSVVSGGVDTDTRYGGNLNYLLYFDLYRMGLVPGAMVKVRAETRYGESVNGKAGPLLPVNTTGFFPMTKELDEDIPVTVTDLTYYQFLSEKFGVFAGKIDTFDGDGNEFASGRGRTQFLNLNFVINPACVLVAPYSTLGAGVVVVPIKQITISSLVFNTNDASTTSGFEGFGEGWTWATEADVQYRLGRLPGGQNIGVMYARDQDFVDIGKRFVFTPGEGFSRPTTDESWVVFWSGWQYLWAEASDLPALDLTNGKPDLKGFGLFWRVGTADQDTNPIEWTISGGLGGRGMIPTRDNDMFGAGYYYTRLQTSRLTSALDVADHVQGFEAFYNLAITPAALLTFDVQVVDDARPQTDTAVILGARLQVKF